MVDVFGAPRNSFPGAPRSSFTLLPLSLLKLRMSLDQNLDLALIGYQELIAIAERKSLDSPSSLAQPELVQALRKHGIGGKPVTDTGTSWINDSKLDSLANTIQALAGEIASMREDRDSIILSLKLEFSELKGEVQQLHQQQYNGSSKPVHCDSPDMQSRCTRTVSTNSTQPEEDAHTLHSRSTSTSRATVPNTNHMERRNIPVHTGRNATTGGALTTAGAGGAPVQPTCTQGAAGSTEGDPHQNNWQEQRRRSNKSAAHSDPITRATKSKVVSVYRKMATENPNPNTLTGTHLPKRCAFFVGNVSPGSKAQSIVTWCADRGVDVYACTIAETQYFGTCYARVSVAEEFEQTLLDKEFWPDTIAHTVRKWRYADSASK